MQAQLDGGQLDKSFARYISETVAHFTPPVDEKTPNPQSNWHAFLFGREPWQGFGTFISSLLGISIQMCSPNSGTSFMWAPHQSTQFRYDVISLNYDLVLESLCGQINEQYRAQNTLKFQNPSVSSDESGPWLCKLHGSIDSEIVPPTWSKGLNSSIKSQWTKAHDLLTNANHIRVLGYSLPQADAYLKYLFKSSVVNARHLKSIDVVTLDSDGTARRRYDDFITFKYYRFASGRIEDYLAALQKETMKQKLNSNSKSVEFDQLEIAHNAFMLAQRGSG
jgi:hypothetical protein